MASEMKGVDNLRILIAGVADNTDIYASADDIRDALDNIATLTARIAELEAENATLREHPDATLTSGEGLVLAREVDRLRGLLAAFEGAAP